ncbi:MAG: undecaprenyldiphospho-muramoylpentapeptide beta-N-acetylglucosaminyltransferase [Anaerolineae bacterium]
MRLLICAGGTGGGVYPALAVLEPLRSRDAALEVLWVGGEGGMEEGLVKRAGITFASIPAAGVHGVGLRALPGNLVRLGRGWLAARRILRQFRPDALFFTGGYVAVPMALAGWRIPTLLYVPDIEPGLALKTLSRFADRIAVTAAESRKYFATSTKILVSGYPLRSDLTAWTRQRGRAHFGLSEQMPVVLIYGGSKGARSINEAVLSNLSALLEVAQVIHISGTLDWSTVETRVKELPSQLAERYHAFDYLHEMGAALAAADLVVARAGASSLGELPFFGLPAILVPYPYAWRYQKVNADYLVQHQAAVVLEDSLLKNELLPTIQALLENPGKRQAMQSAMKSLAQPEAASIIAEQLLQLAGEKTS